MLECSTIALKESIHDLKRLNHYRIIISQIIYLGYLIYEIINNLLSKHILWQIITYSVLTIISIVYFVGYLIVYDKNGEPKKKTEIVIGSKKILKYAKRIAKFYSLVISVVSMVNLVKQINLLNIIWTTLMITFFILQIVFDVVSVIFSKKIKYIMEGINADIGTIMNPVNTLLNKFGKGNPERFEPNETQQKLLLKAEKYKKEKKEINKEKLILAKKEQKEKKSKSRKAFFGNIKSNVKNFFKKDKIEDNDFYYTEEENK